MADSRFLQGRAALVSGGASGMGKAVALALARAGANVAIGSLLADGTRTPDGTIAYLPAADQMRETHAAIEGCGVQVLSMALDVCEAASIADFHRRAVEAFGRVDILVNAAGITVEHPVCGHPDALWNKVIDVNLNGAYRLIRQCLPAMIEGRWGRIVSIASTAASVGAPTSAAYAASKAGLVGLTRCVALEGAPFGVSCNAISPGWVDTAFGRAWMKQVGSAEDAEAYREEVRRDNPQGRIIQPEEVGALAAFLCREEAFGITMQDLVVSAGSLW
jgi:3-hydroxybutyrate dehydrogenase